MTMNAKAYDGLPPKVQPSSTLDETATSHPPVPERAALYVPVDGAFQRIAKMAANLFGAQIATVSIVGDDRIWFPAAEGLHGLTEAPLDHKAFNELWAETSPLVIEDPADDPRTKEHPVMRGDFEARFYVAAPIVAADSQVLGALEAMDGRRRRKISQVSLGLLGDLAALAAQLLQIRVSALTALRAERDSRAAEADQREVAIRRAVQITEAAAAEAAQGRPRWCQLGGSEGCGAPAELKVADIWGDSAWGCWTHAEDALVQVPSVFLASEAPVGLMTYRRRASRV
jgi:hypothetical protein